MLWAHLQDPEGGSVPAVAHAHHLFAPPLIAPVLPLADVSAHVPQEGPGGQLHARRCTASQSRGGRGSQGVARNTLKSGLKRLLASWLLEHLGRIGGPRGPASRQPLHSPAGDGRKIQGPTEPVGGSTCSWRTPGESGTPAAAQRSTGWWRARQEGKPVADPLGVPPVVGAPLPSLLDYAVDAGDRAGAREDHIHRGRTFAACQGQT